jgi:hypothetical protein
MFYAPCVQNSRPLYEQLEDEKAKKEADYDAVTKAMFAPPQVSEHCRVPCPWFNLLVHKL